jgi:decaprenyl-phosphate phosphoribosyltransferase
MTPILALVRALRPRQWTKNVLVFAAPTAAGVITQGPILWRVIVAFAVFCSVSSATYLVNDVLDAAEDRQHPVKRLRPIAAKLVSPRTAVAVATVLMLGGLAAAAAVGESLLIATGLYIVLSVAYSLRLKRIAVLDIGAVAGLFMLRAIAGGAGTGVALSSWFLVVTSFSALFIVVGKRLSELAGVRDAGATTRAVLNDYTETSLRQIGTISAAIAIAAYAMWSFQRENDSSVQATLFHLSTVPLTLAFFRYALLVDRGAAEAPENTIISDRTLLALVMAWVAVFVIAIYR